MDITYKIIAEITVHHDYFTNGSCPDIELHPDEKTKWICYRLQLVFKQINENCWVVLAPDNTDCSVPWEETLEFLVKITNTDFWLYTDLQKGNNGLHPGNIKVTLSQKSVADALKGNFLKESLSFDALKVYWKYIFVANAGNGLPGKMRFLDQSSQPLQFKQTGVTEVGGKTGVVFTSTKPITLKDTYAYRFELYEDKPLGEKLLRKQIEYPDIDAYDLDSGGEKIKTLNQYIYY